MTLQFLHPALLLALALVPAAVWLALQARRMDPRRQRWSAAVRAVVLTALILGLAQPRILRPATERSVAFLVDASDSVPAAERARAEAFVGEAMKGMAADDRAAVVVFGDRALVDRAARPGRLEAIRSHPGGGRSDLGAALRLGSAVLPADTGRRLVLLSDGRANQGALDRQAELARAQGIPIDIVPLAAAVGNAETLVAALEAPSSSRVGQRFDVTAVVRATAAGRGRLQIFDDDAVLLDRAVELAPGDNRFSVPVTVDAPGFHRYRALLVPERDGRVENNQAAAYTSVAGPPKVLVVAADPDRAGPLVSALEAAGRSPELVAPDRVPAGLLGLASYDAVVLADVPASALSREAMDALLAFVRDLGHGLVMIGGEDSFGAGGYKDTPVEKALPVEMEVRDKEKRPDIAIAFVVDKSGSMGETGGGGGPGGFGGGAANKLDLAKEAVLQASELFEPEDQVALITFDDRSFVTWPLQPHTAPGDFERAVSGVQIGGGTNIYAGMAGGVGQVENADAALRHVILLSDGWSDAGGYERLLQQMNHVGVTLSIVGVGQGSAPYLKDLAEDGGGRYYAVEDPADIPQVLVEDTMTALGTYIIEERFQPVPGSRTDILSGLDPASLPPLNGYNGTTAKQSAQVALWSHLEDPVLAQWQHGLGRAAAWTSDLKRQWAADWVDRPEFGTFAVQLVDWTLPAPDSEGFAVETAIEGGTATLGLRASDPAGRSLNDLAVEAHLAGPDGANLTVPLVQSAAGHYRAAVDLPAEGAYLVRLVGRDAAGAIVGAQTAGLVVPYSPEYADPADQPTDPRLFRLAEATGGRVLDDPSRAFDPVQGVTRATDLWPWLFLLAALLFPLDVAVRRLKLSRADLALAAAWLRARGPAGAGAGAGVPAGGERVLGSLFSARERAGTRGGARGGEKGVPATTSAAQEPARPASTSPAARVPTTTSPARPTDSPTVPTGSPTPPTPDGSPPADGDTLARLRQAKRRARPRG